MDFLNKTFAQLSDLWRSMTMSARITSGLLLAVLLVSLVYLFRAGTSGAEDELLHGVPVSASQLDTMVAAFGKAGLSGHEVRGTQIYVPRGQQAKYMAALADAKALPSDFGHSLTKALNEGGFIEDRKKSEERMRIALQEELGLILSQMRGIESGYVLIANETKSGLNREKVTTATASVRRAGSTQLDEEQRSSIRHLVAGAVPGLKAESVTVADLNGCRTYHGGSDSGGSAEENYYFTLKRSWEKDYKAKILNALSLMGVENVTVEPTVILDKERIIHSKKIQHDTKTTPVKETEKTSSRSRQGGGTAGRPGFQSQQPNTATQLGAAGNASRQEDEESTTERINVPSGEEIEKESVGLTPKRVTASVGVPMSYFEKVWHARNPAEEGKEAKNPDQAALEAIRQEETAKIQKAAAAVLPLVEGVQDPLELVTVTAFQDIRAPKPPETPITRHALSWFAQYWPTLGMIVLGFISLMILRSMLRAAPVAASPAPALPAIYPQENTAEPEPSGTPQTAAAKRLRRFQGGGRSLRDELSELVKEDPDVAANILKSWIGHVG